MLEDKNIEEVINNIYRIKIILGGRQDVYLYFIKDRYPTLIDSGPGFGLVNVIRSKLSRIGFDIKNLYYVINTHEHPEHFGGNKELKEINNNIKLCAHKLAQIGMKNIEYKLPEEFQNVLDDNWRTTFERYEHQFDEIAKLNFDITLEDNQIIELGKRKLKVIHTPGHSPGHICLFIEEEKILFSGDHIVGFGTPYVGSISNILKDKGGYKAAGDLNQYLFSLNKLRSMDINVILPAHGDICDKSKIDESITRKLIREQKLIDILKENKKLTLDELTKKLYDDVLFNDYLTGATYAYIKKLREEGKVKKVTEDNKIYFVLE